MNPKQNPEYAPDCNIAWGGRDLKIIYIQKKKLSYKKIKFNLKIISQNNPEAEDPDPYLI